MFEVTISLAGLCAYVPNRTIGDENNPPSLLQALLVDALSGRTRTSESRLSRHRAVLILGEREMGAGGAMSEATRVVDLKRKKVRFLASRNGQRIPLEVVQDGSDRAFDRVAKMAEIDSNWGSVNPICFDDTKNGHLIASRVVIDSGKLFGAGLVKGEQWGFITPDLANDADKLVTAWSPIASESNLEFQGVSEFTIEVSSLDDPARKSLYPLAGGEGGSVGATIGNLCDKDFFALVGTGIPRATGNESLDLDFYWYYDLANAPAGYTMDPLPVPIIKGNAGAGAKCMRTCFDVFSPLQPD